MEAISSKESKWERMICDYIANEEGVFEFVIYDYDDPEHNVMRFRELNRFKITGLKPDHKLKGAVLEGWRV